MTLFRALLYLYPASWRAEYAGEMCGVFASRRRDASGLFSLCGLWLDVIPDLVFAAIAVQWDVLRQDLKHAARSLSQSRTFLVTAVLVAAVGIGATAAAYTMVDMCSCGRFRSQGRSAW